MLRRGQVTPVSRPKRAVGRCKTAARQSGEITSEQAAEILGRVSLPGTGSRYLLPARLSSGTERSERSDKKSGTAEDVDSHLCLLYRGRGAFFHIPVENPVENVKNPMAEGLWDFLCPKYGKKARSSANE